MMSCFVIIVAIYVAPIIQFIAWFSVHGTVYDDMCVGLNYISSYEIFKISQIIFFKYVGNNTF